MGGSSKSNTSSQSTTTDARTVGDGGAVVVGQGATVNFTQGVDKNVVDIFNRAADIVQGIAEGASGLVSDALTTTNAVATRNQVAPSDNATIDILKNPTTILLAGGAVLLLGLRVFK